MNLDDRVFTYVASAEPTEARLAAVATDIHLGAQTVRGCIIVANELAVDVWRDALRIAAETAQARGQIEQAATFRESWDHVEMAMQASPRALGLVGPLM